LNPTTPPHLGQIPPPHRTRTSATERRTGNGRASAPTAQTQPPLRAVTPVAPALRSKFSSPPRFSLSETAVVFGEHSVNEHDSPSRESFCFFVGELALDYETPG